MRNRRNSNIKNIKDYIAPIIIFLVIFFLIYLIFSPSDKKENIKNNTNNQQIQNSQITINFWDENTQVKKITKNNSKENFKNNEKIITWEWLIVEAWDISFNIPQKAKIWLNTNWKIIYLSNDEIELDSNNLWLETTDNFKVLTRYAKVNIFKDSIVNVNQNEVSSTIYVLKWKAEVKNLAWVSTFISAGQKIKIKNIEASKKDLDMNMLKEDISPMTFKIDDWFIKHNASIYIDTKENTNSGNLNEDNQESQSWTTDNKKIENNLWLLNFDNIYDWGSVASSSTNISWKFADERIAKIIINWKNATINSQNKTFNVIWVDTSKAENDLAIKIYDNQDNILWKYLYLIYYSWAKSGQKNNNFTKVNTKSYPVNDEDFIISTPSVKNWKTTSSENTFYGTVKNPNVASVWINGYKLKTFNWKTFRYHAYKRFKTLWEWINNYEIKYLDKDWNVILKKYITIDKISKTKKISQEAKIN